MTIFLKKMSEIALIAMKILVFVEPDRKLPIMDKLTYRLSLSLPLLETTHIYRMLELHSL